MKASSTLDATHRAGRARLNQGPTGSQGTAWCAKESNSDQYLEIDLSKYEMKAKSYLAKELRHEDFTILGQFRAEIIT